MSRSSHPLHDVVLVDAVRTPFGRSRPDRLYACTRADDLAVVALRELLRRHPQVAPERIDDVVLAATSQVGDQGLNLGRTVALLAGLPQSVPGLAVDRLCAGGMTAMAVAAGAIGVGAQQVVVAGGVEHMGHHPMGAHADPNPRFVSERLVDPSALVMGETAENLHDLYPALTRSRADAWGLRSQDRYAAARAAGDIGPEIVPTATRDPAHGFAARPEVRYGATTMCVGLGMGMTIIWENPHHDGGLR